MSDFKYDIDGVQFGEPSGPYVASTGTNGAAKRPDVVLKPTLPSIPCRPRVGSDL